jgi:hypothetical protein
MKVKTERVKDSNFGSNFGSLKRDRMPFLFE